MTRLIDKLKKLLFQQKSDHAMKHAAELGHAKDKVTSAETAVLTEEVVIDLMKQLKNTHEGMYSCAESFALLDEYADLVVDDKDAEILMPLVKAHLDACPDCKKEYQVLMKVLKFDE